MVNNNIVIEGAKLIWRNFSGKEGDYNPKGNRNFCVLLDEKLGKQLAEDGWNIKWTTPKEEGDESQPYIQVAVRFDNFPPKIVAITSGGKLTLNEEGVNKLDWAEITNADVIINPYNWERNGKSGVKAYLKSLYVTLYEDEFERKYSNVPDSALNTIKGDMEE